VTATADDTRRVVRRAAYACIGRFGIAKTTVDDVAREAGISRATIYRLFPGGRDQIVRETVTRETNRFFARLDDELADAPDLATFLERGLVDARRALLEHVVLQKVLATEPELLLPLLTVEQHRILPFVVGAIRPLVARDQERGLVRPAVDPAAAADYLARMALSLMASPGGHDLADPEAVRSLVRGELLGGILV
jgi:AcrR family transcriptional regulator